MSINNWLLIDFKKVLEEAGNSLLTASAYDTAWVARVPSASNPGVSAFPEALRWLNLNQRTDGSWGEGGIPERIISTLSATIALKEFSNNDKDMQRVERGRRFVWQSLVALPEDSNSLPIGFELLLGTLLAEAEMVGLSLPPYLAARYASCREEKLKLLRQVPISQLAATSAIFSMEFLGDDLAHQAEKIVKNGHVGLSPSATAAALRYITDPQIKAEMYNYLQKTAIVEPTGLCWPNFTNFDNFEISWVLYNLVLCDYFSEPELKPQIQDCLEKLLANNTENGFGFSGGFPIADSDTTSMAYLALLKGGYHNLNLNLDKYWKDTHLVTYPLERDASVSANAHGLKFFLLKGDYDSAEILLDYLDKVRGIRPYWLDKWHVSPYYTTSHVILAAVESRPSMCATAIEWLENTQHFNGGWGCQGHSVEETAYALQSLVIYSEAVGWSEQRRFAVESGLAYLEKAYKPFAVFETPLWICKNRYAPKLVVRSAVLSAMLMARKVVESYSSNSGEKLYA